MITAFKPSKPDRPRTHCLKQNKRVKTGFLVLMMKTSKETSILIAFEKPTAIWDTKMDDIPQLAVKTSKQHVQKQIYIYNINTAQIATIEYYTLHVIYHMNGTQVMSAVSNHDFSTKPYVKAPRYDKTSR